MADGIKIGNLDISAFKVGSSDCKVYLGDVLLYPNVETRIVAKYNITDTSNPTKITSNISNFSEIEIDGVELPSVVSAYTFSTTGEHTVKYTLTDPTTIGESAFEECSGLTSIDIPNSVTSIGNEAFTICTSLTSIIIPDSVTSIGIGAFWDCTSLSSITIPSGVTSIGDYAFGRCSGLTSCTIGNGVTSIGTHAFYQCSGLTSITIPNNVTSIGTHAFYGCSGLISCTIGNGVTSIGANAFNGCTGLTSIVSNRITAPTITSVTFYGVKTNGTLTVPQGSSGYDVWMSTGNYYLGKYGWTKVEQ